MLMRMRTTYMKYLVFFGIGISLTLSAACAAYAGSPYTIKIPKQFGSVTERCRGEREGVIIHVQDAHTSFDAQENIAKIIQHLVSNGVVDTVAVEGAEGAISVDDFRLFPDAETRRDVAATMVAHGYLTGAELAAIGWDDSVSLYGVENMKIYDRNLDKFRAVMSKREDIIGELDRIEAVLNSLKEHMYSDDLKTLDAQVKRYYESDEGFMEVTQYVIECAQAHNIDLYQFLNISLFVESLQALAVESANEAALVADERKALVLALLSVAREAKLKTILHKLEASSAVPSDEKQLLLDGFLLKQLRGHGLSAAEYPHFVARAQFAEKFSRVDKGALVDEMGSLIQTVLLTLAEDDAGAAELVSLSSNVRLMRDLVELRVVPSQVDEYHSDAAGFSSVRYLNFLRSYTKRYDISYHPSRSIILIDDALSIASEFYRYAEARSSILVKNAVAQVQESDADAIVLVAGGYHTESMVRAMKGKGYSYLVVSPRIESFDAAVPYLDRMMNVRTMAELRFESAFNTIVNELLFHKYKPLKNELDDLFVTNWAASEVADFYFNGTKTLSLSALKPALQHSQRFLSLLNDLDLGDEDAVHVVQKGDDGHWIVSEKHNIRLFFPKDTRVILSDKQPFSSAVNDAEIADMIASYPSLTLADMRKRFFEQNVSHDLELKTIAHVSELKKQFQGALYGAAYDIVAEEKFDAALRDFILLGENEQYASQFSIAGLDALRRGVPCTAALTVEVIAAIGDGDLSAGLSVINKMLSQDSEYMQAHNRVFSTIIGQDAVHTVLIVCNTKEEKRTIENALPAQKDYTVRVQTKDDLVGQASTDLVRPGKVDISTVARVIRNDSKLQKQYPNAVFGVMNADMPAGVDGMFAFDPAALTQYVGQAAPVKTNIVNLLLAAAHDPEVNMVDLFLEQLATLSGKIIERVHDAMQRLVRARQFTVSA